MPELYKPVTSSLRTRLLLLTICFVLLVEMLIYLPAIGSFRQNFLIERLRGGELAALSLEEATGRRVSPQLESDMLDAAGLFGVVVKRPDFTLQLGGDSMPDQVNAAFDLRGATLGGLILDAWDTLENNGERSIRVMGNGQTRGTRFVEITLDEVDLYEALSDYSNNILLVSVVASLFSGVLVYLALHWLLVRPMRKLKEGIVAFSRNPERVPAAGQESRRRDEIGVVEREFGRMQNELRHALRQKSRLAELGEAVSKINHDLRNILATAQLASEALQRNKDPKVQKSAQRLMSSVSRAVALCERTMRHGKASEPDPEPSEISLHDLVFDVADTLGLLERDDFRFHADFDPAMKIFADEGQIHRAFLNICRNAREAQGDKGSICVRAMVGDDGTAHIRIQDTGPGIPNHVLPNLFKAFNSGGRAGGTGLGLAIARDIVIAHGGQIGLESSGPGGTTFMICLPGCEEILKRGSAKLLQSLRHANADDDALTDSDAPEGDLAAANAKPFQQETQA